MKNNPKWIRQPKQVQISEDKVVILTERGTDLWARTYYGFQNDNAPVFQVETTDKYFSFIVKTEFESTCRFDQCGVAMYLNSDNWFKASIEYIRQHFQICRLRNVNGNQMQTGVIDDMISKVTAEDIEAEEIFNEEDE